MEMDQLGSEPPDARGSEKTQAASSTSKARAYIYTSREADWETAVCTRTRTPVSLLPFLLSQRLSKGRQVWAGKFGQL